MVKRLSSLDSNYPIGIHSNNSEVDLFLKEKKNLQLMQIGAWPDTFNNLSIKIAEELKIESCTTPNIAISKDNTTIMRTEPLKWWIIGNSINSIPVDLGTSLDLSHSYTHLEIFGSTSSLFLKKHLPLDLREKSFPINAVASSAIHHVSIKLWRSKYAYNLFIPRGFALSLWEIFLETAKQFNYEIK